MKIKLIAVIAAIATLAFTPVEQATWKLDRSHSRLGFNITHLTITEVDGAFKKFDAKITTTREDFTDAVVEMTAETNSVSTDNEKRDEHIMGADYFDAAKFPTLTFKSTAFKKTADNKYKVIGNFTFKGITKIAELEVSAKTAVHPMTKKSIVGFKISGSIKRSDFGIGNSTPETILSDVVNLTANAEFVKE